METGGMQKAPQYDVGLRGLIFNDDDDTARKSEYKKGQVLKSAADLIISCVWDLPIGKWNQAFFQNPIITVLQYVLAKMWYYSDCIKKSILKWA